MCRTLHIIKKIVELHKIKSDSKKITRAIIKNFQSTKDVTNLPGRGCVFISSKIHSEEESLSELQESQLDNCRD